MPTVPTWTRSPKACSSNQRFARGLKSGDSWVHLRLAYVAVHVGCCDSSKNKPRTKHFLRSHPLVKSLEPGEDWTCVTIDEVVMGVMRCRNRRHKPIRCSPRWMTRRLRAWLAFGQQGLRTQARSCSMWARRLMHFAHRAGGSLDITGVSPLRLDLCSGCSGRGMFPGEVNQLSGRRTWSMRTRERVRFFKSPGEPAASFSNRLRSRRRFSCALSFFRLSYLIAHSAGDALLERVPPFGRSLRLEVS